MSLSPGTRWQDKLKLKNSREVLDWRAWWLRRGQDNRRVRQGLLETCKHDLLFYVNLFVWQFNPRELGNEVAPFTTYPFQDEDFLYILSCIEDQVNLVSEKSRDMGFSWAFDIISDWLCRFHSNKQILMISRSEAAVESESPDSLFWKIDFIHENLPEWVHQPETFKRRKLYFGYPNGSIITGEASTGRAGVGGRATAILVDEYAQIKEDWEVLHRTSDTSYCRMFNSTHKGLGTAFYRLCTDRESFPASRWRHLVRHWSDHPRKNQGLYRYNPVTNLIDAVDKSYHFPPDYPFVRTLAPVGGPKPGLRSPWYDNACHDKGSARAIAMDLDINPQGSVSQVFDPIKIAHLTADCTAAWWEGDLRFEPNGDPTRPVELERQDNGPLQLWCHLQGTKAPPSKYKVGVDLSTGLGATNSCVQIVDAQLSQKVASYTTPKVKPEKLAEIVVLLCAIFADEYGQPAELVWETPGPGLNFSEVILKLGYRRIYYRSASERTGPQLGSERGKALTPGWYQTNDGKRWLVDRYCAALQNRKYVTLDVEELKETLAFRWSHDGRTVEHSGESGGDDPSGARANHGDRVIAAALAWMLAHENAGPPERIENVVGPPVGSLAWRRLLNVDPDAEPEECWNEDRIRL